MKHVHVALDCRHGIKIESTARCDNIIPFDIIFLRWKKNSLIGIEISEAHTIKINIFLAFSDFPQYNNNIGIVVAEKKRALPLQGN